MNFFPPREGLVWGLSSELWSPKFWEPNSGDLRRGLYAPLKVFFTILVSQRVQRDVLNTKKDLNGRNHELNSRKHNPSKKYRIFESIKLIFELKVTSHTRRRCVEPSAGLRKRISSEARLTRACPVCDPSPGARAASRPLRPTTGPHCTPNAQLSPLSGPSPHRTPAAVPAAARRAPARGRRWGAGYRREAWLQIRKRCVRISCRILAASRAPTCVAVRSRLLMPCCGAGKLWVHLRGIQPAVLH